MCIHIYMICSVKSPATSMACNGLIAVLYVCHFVCDSYVSVTKPLMFDMRYLMQPHVVSVTENTDLVWFN
jgi:hypothetical protein